MASSKSKSAIYRQELKERDPEKFRQMQEREAARTRRRRAERKEKRESGTMTRSEEEAFEQEREKTRIRTSEWYEKNVRTSHSRKNMKRLPVDYSAKKPRDMTPQEYTVHRRGIRERWWARLSSQKQTWLLKQRAASARNYRRRKNASQIDGTSRTFKKGCKAKLRLSANKEKNGLLITGVNLEHSNHPGIETQHDARVYPEFRQLSDEQLTELHELLVLKVPVRKIMRHINAKYGTHLIVQDVHNHRQRWRDRQASGLTESDLTQRLFCSNTKENPGIICVNLPANIENKMERDLEPFRKSLFVNEASLRTKALESSVTEEEIKAKDCLSGDFRFQDSTQTEGCEFGNSLCRHSNEDGVELQNENNETDYKLINDSNQIKCESEITQLDTDSLVSNDVVNIEMEVESIGTDEIKVEIDGCDDFESSVLYPMESEKEHNQASSNDCNDIKLERDEEGGISFSSTSHTTNTDGNQVIRHDRSNSNKQRKLEDCSVSLGPRPDEIAKHLWDSSEIKILATFTLNPDKKIDLEEEKSNQTKRIQSGDKTDKITEGRNVIIENVSLLNQETCIDSVGAFNHNGQLKTCIDQHSIKKLYKCTFCYKTFTPKRLTAHMRHHAGGRPYKCTDCDVAFTLKSHLTTHMRLHTGEKCYQCVVCDKTFAQKHGLTSHMRNHTRDKPYELYCL